MSETLLSGIRILDLSMGWAGPLATRHLADMGAEVIKVESCRHADWWRGWEATPEWVESHGAEKAVSFNTMNRHKLDVTLDLATEQGHALCKRLAGVCDAVIANYSGAVLGKLGLDYEALRAIKSDIVMMSMPAFGSTGPWRHYRAYGSTIEQASGLPHLHGEPDWPPTMLHVAYGDPVAGLNAAAGLLVALRHRARTGEGQYLDLSQSECLFPLAAHGILEQFATGNAPVRRGNRSLTMAPHGVYPCAGVDNWITIQIDSDDTWRRLVEKVGSLPAGLESLEARLSASETLDSQLAEWTRQFDAQALMEELQAVGIIAAAVRGADEIVTDPHLAARQFWPMVDRVYVGTLPQPATPWREGARPYAIDAPAPTLGQHNREVLTTLLGLSDDDIEALTADGIIGDRPHLD